ncbi:MAG: hypothetical protein WD003_02445 [Candidatus Paceibacterota bacterium]
MSKQRKVVDITFAKEGYKGVLEEIAGKGVCPFCPKNFSWHTEPILHRIGKWLITSNFCPYKHTKHHLLLIGEEHKENFAELTTKDLECVQKLTDWAIKEFSLKGGTLTHRFGATEVTGSTVCHLHFHLIVPEEGKTVQFPIG